MMNELDSMCGVPDDVITYRFQEGIKLEIAKKKLLDLPISYYDPVKKMPYRELADGRREYVQS